MKPQIANWILLIVGGLAIVVEVVLGARGGLDRGRRIRRRRHPQRALTQETPPMATANILFTMLIAVFALLGLITLARSARIVKQYEKGLVMRLGKYRSTVDSGLTFLTPFVEDLITVDMREKVINVEPQKVITKDNVTVTV